MIFIGFDLSLLHTGMVVKDGDDVQAYLIEPHKSMRGIERIDWIWQEIKGRLCQNIMIRHGHSIAGIENFAYMRANQAHQLGELHGVVKFGLLHDGIDFNAYAPLSVLKFVTGSGKAKGGKEHMMMGVYKKWKFEPKDNNIADAYGIMQLTMAHFYAETGMWEENKFKKHEWEVLQSIINPKPKKKRKKQELEVS